MEASTHPIFREIPDLWHHIVETMDEALFVVDLSQDIIYFNRRAEQITGYQAEDVVGRHCLTAFRCTSCVAQCRLFDELRVADREAKITRKDGQTVHVLKNAVALRNQAGEVIGGLETFRDITPLREEMRKCGLARASAEDRGKMLAAVLGSIREGIVALDRSRTVVSVSRRALELLALEDESAGVGRSCHELLGGDATLCPRTITVRGRNVRVSEGLEPLVDEGGEPMGHILILTELPAEQGAEESFFGILGRSSAIKAVVERIRQLSHSEVTVLITGESGTGKELAARALHDTSPRSQGPFMAVNCAALPEGLLESEIFGHVKGAFTSAHRDRKGRVELAEEGTLFLDEVGELPLPLQAKLLRLLQERTYERLGEERTRKANIRIIAATNRQLEQHVRDGLFREDLYYRLKVVPVRMPPLRDRGRDILLLAARFLDRIASNAGRNRMHLTEEVKKALLLFPWPGNVRELANVMEYIVALSPTDSIQLSDLPPEVANNEVGQEGASQSTMVPEDQEAAVIVEALENNNWHRLKTAEQLGINRVTLYRMMKRHHITGPRGAKPKKILTR